ncbi:hypothetical protein HHX48_14035 [Salinimonas sp. HHU 13199]|uniref:Secreted protein n=1 Tax=Salinimonas profundi TaxID=2729140 RepID=A0ABR8LKY6_9ALTE|nr:hypothetical protein [Salinimonas profundi]MBD3586861.1 hypothetical protein [Salinimonas profundi]
MKTVYKISCMVAFAMGVGNAQACEKNTIELEADQMIASSAQQTKTEIRHAIRQDLSQEWLLAPAPLQRKEVLTAKTNNASDNGDNDA